MKTNELTKKQYILGETNLTKYISPKIEGVIKNTQKTIKKLKKRGLKHEKKIIEILEKRNYLNLKYSEVDFSFLRMTNQIEIDVPREKGKEISKINVPKFGIYQFY